MESSDEGSSESEETEKTQSSDGHLQVDDVLDMLPRESVIYCLIGCSLVWACGALSIMTNAFTVVDCGNCTNTMITVVNEFELTGDDASLRTWSSSVYMVGNMFGGGICHAGDRFGRRPIFLFLLVATAATAFLATLAFNYVLFCAGRFLQGMCYTGLNLVAWVCAYENSPRPLRSLTTFLFGISWVIGYCAVAPLAYYSPNWRILLGVCGMAPLLLLIWAYCYLPETLHFLVSIGDVDAVNVWLKRRGLRKDINVEELIKEFQSKKINEEQQSSLASIVAEVKEHKIFILHCLILLYLWTCDNFIYFGLSLFSTKLAGNMYVNFVLLGIVELPAYILVPIFLDRLGRRAVVGGTHLVAAVSFFIISVQPDDLTLTLILWLIGKFSISCSYMALFVLSSEVFPTTIRNVCIGVLNVLSRIGGVVAPNIALLASVSATLPPLVLGSIAVLAGTLTFLLPETNRKPLPSTMKQTA